MPVTYKTDGARVIREVEAAIKKAVNVGANDVLKTAKTLVAVDTGRMKSAMEVIGAKTDGDEIYSLISIPVPYAIYSELRTKALRRALASSGSKSLKNFGNII